MPLGDVLQPREMQAQIVSVCLEIEDYGIIQPSQLIDGISWETDLTAGAKISFTVSADEDCIFNNELAWKGPPPGTKNITLWVMYIVDNVPTWKKIISGAIADSSTRKVDG